MRWGTSMEAADVATAWYLRDLISRPAFWDGPDWRVLTPAVGPVGGAAVTRRLRRVTGLCNGVAASPPPPPVYQTLSASSDE